MVRRKRSDEASGADEVPRPVADELREKRPPATERHDAAFVLGAMFGGLAGATAALFRAPQAGDRTREQLASYIDMASQRATDLGAHIRLSSQRVAGWRPGAASSGSRVRVDLQPTTLVRSEAVSAQVEVADTAPAVAPMNVTGEAMGDAMVDSTGDTAGQAADPISGLDPALALTPDLAGTGTATTSIGAEVADEERVLNHEAPLNTDRQP